jgi:D-alanyl-lipoteichoic acid acyltransferase DltB (MBOAT superfamily)
MEITTFLFAGFVLLAVLGFRCLPQRFKNLWLLFACAVFIISWSWQFLVILLLLATINYILGKHVTDVRHGKWVLWAGVVLNLLALLLFKYSNFYLPELTSLLAKLGVRTGAGGIQILVPLGLSFITLQMISYLLDVHYGRMEAETGFVKFAVYALYFPKILAGPIERAKTFLSRLDTPQEWSVESILQNFTLVLVGLIRKIVFADALTAMVPAQAFQPPSQYPAPLLAIWLLAYAFALYNDFAGYTSIVRGVSGFFGIELTSNFNVPYFSRSFSEFWNRWHISLSSWLRDYIYYPLSRRLRKTVPNHNNALNLIVPPVLTMLVSGLWHGLGWNTLLWGGLQGTFLVLERIAGLWGPRYAPAELPRWRQVISAAVVFFCILLAWVPFHTGVIPAIHYWQNLFSITNWQIPIYKAYFIQEAQSGHFSQAALRMLAIFPFFQVALVLLPALGLDLFQYKGEFTFRKWPVWLQVVLLALVVLILFLLSFAEKGAPFIYQSF